MTRSPSSASLSLVGAGLLMALAPAFVLGFSRPLQYEVELVRWVGVATVALAGVRPWALAAGGGAARRMRRWTGLAAALAVGYVVTTTPLFLLLGFAALAASVLDAGVERATVASNDLRARLREEAGGA